MIRLDLSREPHWLHLGHGVRMHVGPLTTSLMASARSNPALFCTNRFSGGLQAQPE